MIKVLHTTEIIKTTYEITFQPDITGLNSLKQDLNRIPTDTNDNIVKCTEATILDNGDVQLIFVREYPKKKKSKKNDNNNSATEYN